MGPLSGKIHHGIIITQQVMGGGGGGGGGVAPSACHNEKPPCYFPTSAGWAERAGRTTIPVNQDDLRRRSD